MNDMEGCLHHRDGSKCPLCNKATPTLFTNEQVALLAAAIHMQGGSLGSACIKANEYLEWLKRNEGKA